MANTKISALTSATTPLAGTEVLPIVQSGVTVKVAVSNLTAGRSVSATSFAPTGSAIPANGLYLPAANAVGIATNSTNAVYIDSSQNVSLGTSSTSYKFEVQGSVNNFFGQRIYNTNAGSSAVSYLQIGNNTNGATAQLGLNSSANTTNIGGANALYLANGLAAPVVFATSNAERMRIDSSGIITMNAYGAGAATFSASGVISSVSDETWKIKDGVPADPDSMLKKLEPGYWYYNDEKKEIFGVDRQLGFYAQNVNAAIGPEAAPQPEVVTTKALDGTDIVTAKPWGYYDRSVLAITVMSLQKALSTIESLTARIQTLESKNPA